MQETRSDSGWQDQQSMMITFNPRDNQAIKLSIGSRSNDQGCFLRTDILNPSCKHLYRWWKSTHVTRPCLGLDQICFFFTHFAFLFCSNFLPILLLYCTHFAFNYTHFASHDEVMLHKFAAPIPSAILVDLSSCCSHQQ